MWVNKTLFQTVLDDNKKSGEAVLATWNTCHLLQGKYDAMSAQKAKDDMTIDWMRHRINALEKEKALMLAKLAGIHIPVPEIVPTRPGTLSMPDFQTMPSFEDVGETEAQRLGIQHNEVGELVYTK